ncbi:hypothetical protein K470DRAFT_223215 [Piedraia hortae CBS 480.64]|uniref:non-specific serine/threonine protein kinase n=1 Tax=Piedraia hortae CBS 480.64 TaxID=1314780 RepID=A0A6A7BRK5_9PEZI|nr:hypothetical protein K470DRAFT_223215 [Piedraia hortae CBS 480.64]
MRSPTGLFIFEGFYRHVSGKFHHVHLGGILHNGRYGILQKLGCGSFPTVWAVRDEQEQRYVAIKIPIADAPSSFETSVLELEGPNGIHSCTVTDIYGDPVGLDLEEEKFALKASAARRHQKHLPQAIDCLH